MIKEIVNKSEIFYNNKWENSNLCEYHNFILDLLKDFLIQTNQNFSVNFGCDEKKDINLYFQYEHTIVKEKNNLICKIHNYEYLNQLDYVFEYSNCNVSHIKKSDVDETYKKKLIYVPPLLYKNDIEKKVRSKNIITIHNSSPRRNLKHQEISMDYFHNVAGYNIFSKEKIKEVLDEYKILVNIHQIDHHITLEELRVLPALLTGILVVSENVPYKEEVPYNNHIVWFDYDNMKEVIEDVISNYDFYRIKYLTGLSDTIDRMEKNLRENINKIFNL
jgi:hypothetical protein